MTLRGSAISRLHGQPKAASEPRRALVRAEQRDQLSYVTERLRILWPENGIEALELRRGLVCTLLLCEQQRQRDARSDKPPMHRSKQFGESL